MSSQAALMAVVSMLVLFLFCFVVVDAEVVQDRLSEGQARKLHFVSKFCYSTDGASPISLHLPSRADVAHACVQVSGR